MSRNTALSAVESSKATPEDSNEALSPGFATSTRMNTARKIGMNRIGDGVMITPYEAGRLAYLQDENLEDNPYPVGTVEAAAWEMGFKDCAAEIRVGG